MMAQTVARPSEGHENGIFGTFIDELRETLIWYDALDPTFKFLFALPFIVAAAGFLSDWLRRRRGNRH
jgi:hypothetical protein